MQQGEWETTAEHFEKFKEYALYYRDKFKLYSWEMHFAHETNGTPLAQTQSWYLSRLCEIRLGPIWYEEPTDGRLKFAARHEILELLLGPLTGIASSRFTSQDEIDAADHEAIRLIENLLDEAGI